MSWTVKGKDKRNWYVTVSGGYVIFGHWVVGDPLSTKDTHCNMEQFLAGQFHAEIKEHMGEPTFKEVHGKVSHLVELKNQKTSSPLKSS